VAASDGAVVTVMDPGTDHDEHGGRRRHRRRSRSSRQESKRPSNKTSLLLKLGRRLTRRGKVIVCVSIVGLALVLTALVRRLETLDGLHSNSFVSAVGFAPAMFVTVLGVGALVLAQAIGYKRKRLWLTTIALMVYLVLHVVSWHRAWTMARDAFEPQVIGDIENPDPGAPVSPTGIDIYVLGLYTIGSLSTISTVLLMRKLIRWSTPSSTTRVRLEAEKAAAREGDPPEAEGQVPSDLGAASPLEVQDVELAALDEPAAPAAPSSKTPEVADEERPRRRGTFE
jgi:hypothetical protein